MEKTRSTIVRSGEALELEVERWYLHVTEGPDRGLSLALGERPLVVGRSSSVELVLGDGKVSRRHIEIQPAGRGWKVSDLGSRSGLYLNGVRVEQGVVEEDAVIRIGETSIELRREREVLKVPDEEGPLPEDLIAESPAMRELLALVRRVAVIDLPVLLTGETGSGKGRIARLIHELGPDPERPFVVVDCTLLDREHLRSELFGHVKGAFTGADATRDGAFERAGEGTLFLDEIGELPLELQPTLLRALEEGTFQPLGGSEIRKACARVLAATNKDLSTRVGEGSFREDLFYRLSALSLEVPPLRDRADDMVALAASFLPEGTRLAADASGFLTGHDWPGNVRELRNVVRSAAALAPGGELDAKALGAAVPKRPGSGTGGAGKRGSSARPVREIPSEADVRAALERSDGNRSAAAREFGVDRSTLWRWMKKYGIH